MSQDSLALSPETTYRNPPTGLFAGTLPTTPTTSSARTPDVENDRIAALVGADNA
jgi:hypothetical protein